MKGSKNRMGLTKGSICYTSTTVTYFMAILQFIDYSKFKRFSNIADEISTKLLSSRKIVVLDRYDFKFSVKADERKRRTGDSTHIQEIETIDYRKVPKPFQSYLANSNNKTNLGKYLFQKWRETFSNGLASSQTICFVNLGGVTQWTQDYFQTSVLSRKDM